MTKAHQPCFIRRPLPAAPQRVHVIGIAGAAMGTFATMLQSIGLEVRGSDQNVFPPMSDHLTAQGIQWVQGFAAENLSWGPDWVIIGNVCRRDNPEAVAAIESGVPYCSFPQALSDLFLAQRRPAVITGTHGKTTTTTLCAWLLHEAGLDPSYLAGGRSENFAASYRVGAEGQPFVVEGDEYDTAFFDKGPKFLHYRPEVAVINNIEFDHADIYDDIEEICENFARLVALIPTEGKLFVNGDDPRAVALSAQCAGQVIRYGFSEGCDWRASAIEAEGAGVRFTLERPGHAPISLSSALSGRHNVGNALAALAVAEAMGAPLEKGAPALLTFQGVDKRQQQLGEAAGVLVIDDYAQHPTAVRETLAALQLRYPARRLVAVYEPKSNTARRAVHQLDYIPAFQRVAKVLFARPFKKRDDFPPEARLDLERLVHDLSERDVQASVAMEVDEVVSWALAEVEAGDLLVFLCASNLEGAAERVLSGLRGRG